MSPYKGAVLMEVLTLSVPHHTVVALAGSGNISKLNHLFFLALPLSKQSFTEGLKTISSPL